MRIRNILLPFVVAAVFPLVQAAAQNPDVAVARRIAAIGAVALEEYALGVQNGRIVARAELDEASSFLEEATRKLGEMSPAVQGLAAAGMQEITAGVKKLAPVGDLEARLEVLRKDLEHALNAPLDPMPSTAPSLARAARTFQNQCSECHGTTGRGDGVRAKKIDPKPTNFTLLDSLSSSNPLAFYRKITVGVSGTEMQDWEKVIGLDERWGLALYVTSLRYAEADRARGDTLVRAQCAECLSVLSDISETASLTDDSLRALLAGHFTSPPAPADLHAMTAFARTASAAEALGGDRSVELARTLKRTGQELDRALAFAKSGDRTHAQESALDAYMAFERIETPLRARDAAAATTVEQAFGTLRAALATGDEPEILRARAGVDASLTAAESSLKVEVGAGMLFGQSFVIIVREGLEAILIIGALMAFVVKAGAPERKKEMGWGVVAALVASVLTAGAMLTVLRETTVRRDALEGITMLVAAAVLFSVSYWLVSKIEVRKWHSFVTAQIRRAITSRRAFALVAVAFLAVYREGFETVLFYLALFASGRGAPGGAAAIVSGLLLGLVVLGIVYYAIQKYGVKIPLKPFFAVTSALLYIMAFSFAGQGIAELQETGMIGATPLRWAPTLPALGIYPTTQTMMIQLVLALAFVGALAWVFWLEPKKA